MYYFLLSFLKMELIKYNVKKLHNTDSGKKIRNCSKTILMEPLSKDHGTYAKYSMTWKDKQKYAYKYHM